MNILTNENNKLLSFLPIISRNIHYTDNVGVSCDIKGMNITRAPSFLFFSIYNLNPMIEMQP